MQNKPLFIYVNPKTSKMKEVKLSIKKIVAGIVCLIALVIFSLKYSVDFLVDFSQNSRISKLTRENEVLQTELKKISQKITYINSDIDWIEKKDDQIRAMLDLPPITADVRQVGIGGATPSAAEINKVRELSFGNELINSWNFLEQLEREIRLEKTSYQTLLKTVELRQDSLKYLPVLKPVPSAYISSSFGNRFHPILKKRQFHKGIDLAANSGTPIIAPADGKVVSAGTNQGYGKFVQINHKYGFETAYGHLKKIYVRKGQTVKRGDKIGEVGSTGLSTSNHLHYEVRFKGKALNPRDFFLNDILH